jgi:hypothetical protein
VAIENTLKEQMNILSCGRDRETKKRKTVATLENRLRYPTKPCYAKIPKKIEFVPITWQKGHFVTIAHNVESAHKASPAKIDTWHTKIKKPNENREASREKEKSIVPVYKAT